MGSKSDPTTSELRAAFNRAPALRFVGYSFAKALATPLVRKALIGSAKAHAGKTTGHSQAVLL